MDKFFRLDWRVFSFGLIAAISLGCAASAAPKYDPGASDTEIKLGNTMAYSGPASVYGTIGRAELAYFAKVNDEGGVNGRRITMISRDDGYNPAKTIELTRGMVERDKVLLMFSGLGTGPDAAVHKYLNRNKVPQLFIASTGMQWNDPANFPWTMAFAPNQTTNLRHETDFLLKRYPDAKVAVLYENTDFGIEYLKALKDLLGDNAKRMIVAEASYETTDPTIDTQIVTLKASGATAFFNLSTPRFAVQAIRKIDELGWKPLHFLPSADASIATVLTPAGLTRSIGIYTSEYWKDPTEARWQSDPAVKEYLAWMKRYFRDGDVAEIQNVYGYSAAQLMVHVLKQCGDDLTRANVMRQAASLKGLTLPMLLPGITVNTSPSDFLPVKDMFLARFDGKEWAPVIE